MTFQQMLKMFGHDEGFWLRKERAQERLIFVRPFGPNLSRALNHHSCLCLSYVSLRSSSGLSNVSLRYHSGLSQVSLSSLTLLGRTNGALNTSSCFSGKIWLGGNFLLALQLLLQLIKTDNLMKITGIDLFYYLPSIFYNFYNDDFCLILLLCRAKSDGKSVD